MATLADLFDDVPAAKPLPAPPKLTVVPVAPAPASAPAVQAAPAAPQPAHTHKTHRLDRNIVK